MYRFKKMRPILWHIIKTPPPRGAATQRGSWPPHSWDFLHHTQRRTTVGRTPLDEWSARRRDLYLTTHNTHNKHPCPRCDSNPRSQQGNGRRPTPWIAWPLGPALLLLLLLLLLLIIIIIIIIIIIMHAKFIFAFIHKQQTLDVTSLMNVCTRTSCYTKWQLTDTAHNCTLLPSNMLRATRPPPSRTLKP